MKLAKFVTLALLFFTNTSLAHIDVTLQDVLCLAKNVYHESSIESTEGKIAVAWVVLNRYNDISGEWPNDICGVVYEPSRNPLKPRGCAFSWTCDSREDVIDEQSVSWALSMTAAWLVLSGQEHYDPTFGAKHYVQCGIRRGWLDNLEFIVRIGRHCFYE